MDKKTETVIFGGGCFWCTEAIFQRVKGVIKVTPGYSGGNRENPTYEQVCSGATNHAEVIKVEFDPSIISFEILARIFFATHDPTQLNRQGADTGTQYRSVIYYMDDTQKETIEKLMKEFEKENTFGKPVMTKVEEYKKFYEAEAYHHDYYNQNAFQPYCQVVISPKLSKFREEFKEYLTS